ncbi:Deoxycytidine triphosphate deaminase [Alteromonas macleodii ATCC 27126]|nr:Deoxycytidine triphosphate deaminase [Alteromonas macleodii ATCC 27126]
MRLKRLKKTGMFIFAAASEQGADIDYEAAREVVYKMPHSEWKEKHQLPATDEQLEKLAARQGK